MFKEVFMTEEMEEFMVEGFLRLRRVTT